MLGDVKRRGGRGPFSRIWIPGMIMITLIYCLFVVKLHYTTIESTARNTIGDEIHGTSPFDSNTDKRTQEINNVPVTITVVPTPLTIKKMHVTETPQTTTSNRVNPMTTAPLSTLKQTKAVAKEIPPAPEPVKTMISTQTIASNGLAKGNVVNHEPPELQTELKLPSTMTTTTNDRYITLSGYDAMIQYLSEYRGDDDHNLFLYFTCSNDNFEPYDWSSICQSARNNVLSVFDASPASNRLVTIYAGSGEYWKYQNAFRADRDIRLKMVPCVMKWVGGGKGETSGKMVGETLLDEPFLRYFFKNVDKPDTFLTPEARIETKKIVTVSSYSDYKAHLTAYQASIPSKLNKKPPMYMVFVSGRLPANNRPWCPYCRYSELPLEYSFYAFAPPNAKLLRVEVSSTYVEWKKPNEFTADVSLGPLRGIPAFFTIHYEHETNTWHYERIYERLDRIATLRNLFQKLTLAAYTYE